MPATVVRRLTIQAEERGSSQVVQRLRDVTEAARAVAKVTADGAVVVDMTAAKAGNLTRSYERLAGRLETNASATKNFVRDLETAKRALDGGLTSVENYKRLVGSLQQEFQSLGTAKFSPKVDQSGLNELLGVQTAITNSARDVAAVFEAEARASEAAAAEAARHAARIDDLRAAFDPAYDAARKMAAEIDRLAELERAGITIMGGYEAALDRIVLKYDEGAQAAAQAAQEQARALERAADETARYALRIEDLRASFDPAYDAARKMADEIDRLAELERSGIAIMGGYEAALDRIALKYDENAQAAVRAAAARTKMIEQARAEQTASNSAADGQSMWNSYAGVTSGAAGSARDSFAVFEEDAKQMEALQARVVKLRAEIDPLGAAFEKMTTSIAGYQDLADRQLITQDELTLATRHSREEFDKTAKDLGAFNGKMKLTAEQTKNLGFQLNDALTMFLSGSSPFQIMATQGGQVYQALGDGPGGVKGSLEAMKDAAIDAARSIGPIGLGVAAVTVAAGALYYVMHDKFESVDDILKRQAESVRGLREAYGLLAPAAEDAGRRSAAALKFQATKSAEKDLDNLRTKVRGFYDQFQMVLQDTPGSPAMYEPLRKVFADLTASAEAGVPKFREAQEALAKIAETDPSKGFLGFGAPVRRFAQEMVDAAGDGAALQASLEGVQDELTEVATRSREAAAALKQARADMGQFLPAAKTQAQQIDEIYYRQLAAVSQLGGDDRDMQSALRKAKSDRQKAMEELSRDAVAQAKSAQDAPGNLSLSPDQRSLAEIRQRYDTEIKELERVNGAEEAIAAKRRERDAVLKAGQIEIQRGDEARRAGYKFDLDAVTARTAEAKASVAAERARIEALSQGYTDAEAAARAEEQRTLSLAQAKEQLAESARQQLETSRGQVDQIKLEIDLVGKSAGETARLRAEFDALAAAKQAARAAGFDESTATLTEDMKKQAAAIGEATAALEEMNFQRDIAFRVKQAGRSEQDQRIADELRSSGVDLDSTEGQRRAGMLRYVDAVEKAGEATRDLKEATKDAFGEIVASISRGESVFKSFAAGLAQVGQKMASQGFDKLSNWLMGGASPIAAPSLSRAPTFTVAAPVVRSGGIGSDYASQVSPVKISTSDLASASGQIMAYSSRFNSSVDKRLLTILNTAASRFDMPVTAISGLRPGDSRYHGKGLATDVQIYGANGQALNNYQDPATFRVYERFAQLSKQVQSELFPELEGMLRWGGYFSGGKGKYGALDLMHLDLAGNRVGMGGGSWKDGLTAAQRAIWPTVDSQGMTSKAVSEGTIDAQRKMASGAVPIPTSRPTPTTGGVNIDPAGGMGKLGAGMQTLGVGLGAIAQGYQSGSVGGGALGGFMAGLSTGNPVLAVGGAILGAVGGIFGKKAQKKAAQKQKWEQAEQDWQQNLPQFRQFEDQVTRTQRGALSTKFKEMQETLKQFDDLAKKGKGDRNNDQIRRVRAEMQDLIAFLSANFIRDLPQVIADLGKGFGTDTTFTKARDNVMSMADSYRGLLKDITDAYAIPVDQRTKILADFDAAKKTAAEVVKRETQYTTDAKGNVYKGTKTTVVQKDDPAALAAAVAKRDQDIAAFDAKYGDAVARMNRDLEAARNAAIEGLLRIVSGDIPEQSDIEKAIQEAAGAASGLRTALVDLGLSAEQTSAAIDKALAQRMEKLRTDFAQGLQDQIDDIDGKGYLASLRSLTKQRDGLLKDASLVNVDTSLVDTFFAKQAQSIVDGAELTGKAFDDLIKAFPQLAGVVHAFVDETTRSAAAIADRLQGYLDRYRSATTDTSTLAGAMSAFDRQAARDRLAETKAGGGAIASLDAALAAEKAQTIKGLLVSAREAELQSVEELIDGLESFRDQVKETRKSLRLDDNLSVLSGKDQAFEAQKEFRETLAKANAGDKDAQGKLASASQTYLEEFRAYYKSSVAYYDAFNEVQTALANSETLADSQLDTAKKQLQVVKDQLDALNGIKDTVDVLAKAYADAVKEAAKAADKAGVGNGSTGTTPTGSAPNVSPQSVQYLAANADVAAAIAAGNTFGLAKGMAPEVYAAAHYGLFGQKEGRGWAGGGYTGPGGVNEVAGNVHRGEVVFSQADIARHGGVGPVEALRLSRPALPSFEQMAPRPVHVPASSNDNELRIAKLEKLLMMLIQTTGAGLDRIAEAAEANAESADELAAGQRRTASRGRQ